MHKTINRNMMSGMLSPKFSGLLLGMKGCRKLTLRAFALLFALGALMPGRVWAYDRLSIAPVSIIQVAYNGTFGVQLQGVDQACSNGGGPWAWFDTSIPGYTVDGQKELLATLEAAKLSGSTVWLFTDIQGGTCYVRAVNL